MKLRLRMFKLDTGKKSFTEGMDSHWNSLHRAVVTTPSRSEFKKHLDKDLSHIV